MRKWMEWGRGYSNMIYEGVIGLVWNIQGHGPAPWVAKSQLAKDKGLVRKTSGVESTYLCTI